MGNKPAAASSPCCPDLQSLHITTPKPSQTRQSPRGEQRGRSLTERRLERAVADARLGLDAIVAAIGSATRSSDAASRIAAAKKRKFDGFNELAFSDATPIRPERVIASLQRNLPADAVIVADPGTPCPYVSGYYEFLEPGRHFISNRAHGALGYSMSGAVGAQLGRPNAMVVALMGDGSFGFTAGELETIVRLGVPITMVVFSNSVFGWIKAGQRAGFGERYFSVDFNRTDHAKVAEASTTSRSTYTP